MGVRVLLRAAHLRAGRDFHHRRRQAAAIYPGAWLGISFTLLLLFVALATTVKARGIGAILLILLLIGAAAGTQFIMNIDGLFKTPPAILVA